MAQVLRFYAVPGRRDAFHPRRFWEELEAIVWHFTGGIHTPRMDFDEDLGGAVLADRPKIGWHGTIPRDCLDDAGQPFIYQHYEWDERVSHAGGSILEGRGNVNGRTIGIELANMGELTKRGDRWVSKPGLARGQIRTLPEGRQVFTADDGTFWEAYTPAQLEVVRRLRAYFDDQFPGVAHVRHQDIKAGKSDPGPALPWPIAA